MRWCSCLIICLSTNAFAQPSYQTRAGDALLDAQALAGMILDRDLEFFDGGVSRYRADGSYSWTYSAENGGSQWPGTYEIAPDGVACIEFKTLRPRCDRFVWAGDRLVLLTEDGQRYPVRDIR